MSRLFTLEQEQFIKNNVTNKTSEELTNLVNQKFNLSLTIKQVRQYKKSHKLRSGINTQFKKNQIPHNKKSIGYEFTSSDGYTYIKTSEPNIYQHKQIYIYEQVHGKIPKNHSVMFLDQDKSNFDLDNLILVENKDKLTAKNKHLIFEDKELTRTGLLIARVINKASGKKRKDSDKKWK